MLVAYCSEHHSTARGVGLGERNWPAGAAGDLISPSCLGRTKGNYPWTNPTSISIPIQHTRPPPANPLIRIVT